MLSQGFNADSAGNIGTAGLVSASAPALTAGTYAPKSLTLAGAERVDGSGTTQPISAVSLPLPALASTSTLQTVTNTTLSAISGQLPVSLGAKTGANSLAVVLASDETVPISAVSLPLPAGAATSAIQATQQTTLSAISTQLPTALGQKTSANSLAVVLASDEIIPVTQPMSTTATPTAIAASTTSVVLLAASATTKGWIIVNDSISILYVGYFGTTSPTSYSLKLMPNQTASEYLSYGGVLSGIWVTATGTAHVTQLL